MTSYWNRFIAFFQSKPVNKPNGLSLTYRRTDEREWSLRSARNMAFAEQCRLYQLKNRQIPIIGFNDDILYPSIPVAKSGYCNHQLNLFENELSICIRLGIHEEQLNPDKEYIECNYNSVDRLTYEWKNNILIITLSSSYIKGSNEVRSTSGRCIYIEIPKEDNFSVKIFRILTAETSPDSEFIQI